MQELLKNIDKMDKEKRQRKKLLGWLLLLLNPQRALTQAEGSLTKQDS